MFIILSNKAHVIFVTCIIDYFAYHYLVYNQALLLSNKLDLLVYMLENISKITYKYIIL